MLLGWECSRNNMKAITVTQPFATLIALGYKRFETRSWSTKYGGEIAIHAGASFPKYYQNLCIQEPFLSILIDAGYVGLLPGAFFGRYGLLADNPLPRGKIIAYGVLAGCFSATGIYIKKYLAKHPIENKLGNFEADRYAFEIINVKPLDKFIPYTGKIGLWSIPEGLI